MDEDWTLGEITSEMAAEKASQFYFKYINLRIEQKNDEAEKMLEASPPQLATLATQGVIMLNRMIDVEELYQAMDDGDQFAMVTAAMFNTLFPIELEALWEKFSGTIGKARTVIDIVARFLHTRWRSKFKQQQKEPEVYIFSDFSKADN